MQLKIYSKPEEIVYSQKKNGFTKVHRKNTKFSKKQPSWEHIILPKKAMKSAENVQRKFKKYMYIRNTDKSCR